MSNTTTEYVRENRGTLVNVARHGSETSRAYALTLLDRGTDAAEWEQVKAEIERVEERGLSA